MCVCVAQIRWNYILLVKKLRNIDEQKCGGGEEGLEEHGTSNPVERKIEWQPSHSDIIWDNVYTNGVRQLQSNHISACIYWHHVRARIICSGYCINIKIFFFVCLMCLWCCLCSINTIVWLHITWYGRAYNTDNKHTWRHIVLTHLYLWCLLYLFVVVALVYFSGFLLFYFLCVSWAWAWVIHV